MANANQLKIEARRKEASGDYAAASGLYRRALDAMEQEDSLADPSLLVRVADLEYRQDDRDSALGYYKRAVEDYAEQGLITNAIAVCNKILRVYPEEVGCYRRLADLHMDVGLVAEARQNMLRYVDHAWERGDTGPAIAAMEEILARSPDQEIALEMATCLARLEREEDALEVLARVWRERTKADADVEALERKARELDPDVVPDDWLPPSGKEIEEPGMAGADSFVPDDPATPDDEEALDGDAPGVDGDAPGDDGVAGHAPDGEVAHAGADGARVSWEPMSYGMVDDLNGHGPPGNGHGPPSGAGTATIGNRLGAAGEEGRDVELVASFPERFTEIMTMKTTEPPEGTPPGPAAASGHGTRAHGEETPGAEKPGTDPLEGEEWAMDEPRARGEEVAAADEEIPPPPRSPRGSFGGGPEPGPAGPVDRPEASTESLGEKEELRRGLELLEDLLEVDPGNTELMERKVRYARRLGDSEEMVEAYLELAEGMAERGSRRGARLLYEKVLELDGDNRAAEAGLGRLDRDELEQKRQSGGRAGAAGGAVRDPSPGEEEARRELGTRLWTEFEKAVREMPWLHAATQTYQATGPDAAPPVEAFEMLAHYLISRDRCREAADILERAVEVANRSDDEIADALYYLGLAHERLGDSRKAAEYFRRLDAVDPQFASVREWLPGDERAES